MCGRIQMYHPHILQKTFLKFSNTFRGMTMYEFQLKYTDIYSYSSIDSELQLIQILAWHRTGKSLSGPNVDLGYWWIYSSPGTEEFILIEIFPSFNVTSFCHGSNSRFSRSGGATVVSGFKTRRGAMLKPAAMLSQWGNGKNTVCLWSYCNRLHCTPI